MKIFVKNLSGCIQRKADVRRYKQYFQTNGHEIVNNIDDCDIIFLWTCAYRKDYHDNSLRVIDAYKKKRAQLIVGGCLMSIDPTGLREHFSGQCVEWKHQNTAMDELFRAKNFPLHNFEREFIEKCIPSDMELYKMKHPEFKITYSDQFIKVFPSEGCEMNCSYCAEKLAFPPYNSIPIDDIVTQCRSLIQQTGQKRVVLWADSLGDYGHDSGTSLPELINSLLTIDKKLELGLENIHPKHFLSNFDVLMDFIRSGAIFLLKIPIQSAVDRVLELMNRCYTVENIEKIFSSIMATGFRNFETDVIAGFPTEARDEFRQTIKFLVRHRVKYVLLSGYLETAGMASSALHPKTPPEEIRRRLREAFTTLDNAGIFHNSDNSESSQERFAKDYIEL